MSYSITIRGHKDGLDADAGRAFEEGVAEWVRAFVAELEGVTSANIGGQYIGAQSLTAPAEPGTDAAESGDTAAGADAPAEPDTAAPAAGHVSTATDLPEGAEIDPLTDTGPQAVQETPASDE